MPELTWEQAVEWLRRQPDQEALVRACYYDDPLIDAARRFAGGDEWREMRRWFPAPPGRALDVGAGRGISSYALAADGWKVTALEPDPSPIVGAGAIRRLARESGLPINVVETPGERLPFPDETFHLVNARQVLHHARDLDELCRQIARVLRPGGRLVATREHVISRADDLDTFLKIHPLHKWYGGEHACRLEEYATAIRGAGLRLVRVLGPYDSVVNYFPMTRQEWHQRCGGLLAGVIGSWAAKIVANDRHALGRWVLRRLAARLSRRSNTPGRLYSFIADKTR